MNDPARDPHPVTLREVALEAGVSEATASRVVNGSLRRVAEAYRDRVEAAATRLGYTTHLPAQATARGTSAMIALLVADICDPYFGRIAAGVAQAADESDVVVTIAMTANDPQREILHLRELRGLRPRGVILASRRTEGSATQAALREELAAFSGLGGRVVAVGRGANSLRTVPVENYHGAYLLAESILRLGYRRAIVLAAQRGMLSSDDRVAGFRSGFSRGGGVVEGVYRGGYSWEGGRSAMHKALQIGIQPGTAVLTVSDVTALGAMAAIHETGRTVGTDIAVAGFGDTQSAQDVTPSLTTVNVPLEDVGYAAVRAVLDERWDEQDSSRLPSVELRDSTPAVQHGRNKPRRPRTTSGAR